MLLKDHGRLNSLSQRNVPARARPAAAGRGTCRVLPSTASSATAILNALWVRVIVSGCLIYRPRIGTNCPSRTSRSATRSGLIAANGICLPSFYFYGLLAGIKTTMLGVTAHAIKGMAAGGRGVGGVAANLRGDVPHSHRFSARARNGTCFASRWVSRFPFVAGIFGTANLYEGFVGLADTMTCSKPQHTAMLFATVDICLGRLLDVRDTGGGVHAVGLSQRLDAATDRPYVRLQNPSCSFVSRCRVSIGAKTRLIRRNGSELPWDSAKPCCSICRSG